MKKIIILDASPSSVSQLNEMLDSKHYPHAQVNDLSALENLLETGQYLAVILDIDSVAVDNRTIRNLSHNFPGIRFLCTSKDRFHPELKDAICYHMYACLKKPVDPDELLFWIKCIYEEEEIID